MKFYLGIPKELLCLDAATTDSDGRSAGLPLWLSKREESVPSFYLREGGVEVELSTISQVDEPAHTPLVRLRQHASKPVRRRVTARPKFYLTRSTVPGRRSALGNARHNAGTTVKRTTTLRARDTPKRQTVGSLGGLSSQCEG